MGGTNGTNHLAKAVPYGKQGKTRNEPYCGDGFGYMWEKPEWDRMIAGESMVPCIACQRALERDAALEELKKLKESIAPSEADAKDFELAFRQSFTKSVNQIVMNIHPSVDYSKQRFGWNGYIGLTIVESKIRDEEHRAAIEAVDGQIIGDRGYFTEIENFWQNPRDLNVAQMKPLMDAYQLAIKTAKYAASLLEDGVALVDVYTAIGGHAHEHEKAMQQDLGMIEMTVRPVGKCYFAFAELWESLEELKAYYLSRFPHMTFREVERDDKTVAKLRAEGRHLVRKGTRYPI